MHVLLVEDHPELSLWLGRALRQAGLEVAFALDGDSAAAQLHEHAFDLVVLDLSLPKRDGMDVLAGLRARGDTVPVLILTARSDVSDRVRGLNAGADDYLPKPFDLVEFEARVQALLRRPRELRGARKKFGPLELDVEQNAFYLHGAPLALSKREYRALKALFERAGRAVGKDFLFSQVFADADANPDAVEVAVFRLRKRLEKSGLKVATLRGLGYMLQADGEP